MHYGQLAAIKINETPPIVRRLLTELCCSGIVKVLAFRTSDSSVGITSRRLKFRAVPAFIYWILIVICPQAKEGLTQAERRDSGVGP